MERHDQQKEVETGNADKLVPLIKLRHLCRWIREANNEDITKCALPDFPKYIILEHTILPTDITNLFYVIRAAPPQDFTLMVHSCKFTDDTLTRFWKEVAASKTKIRSFHLEYQPISDDDSSCIVDSLQHVQKLRLQKCGVSRNLVRALTEKWEEIGTDIEELELSRNEKIGDAGFVSLARLPGIRRLELWSCDISSKGCAKFAEEMIKTNHKIEELELSRNEKIDDAGFVILARLPGIRRLKLSCCDISSKGCAEFVEEMIKTNHKLEDLNLMNNRRIGDDGARSLFRCFHLIEKLRLHGCGVTYAVKEEIGSELIRLNLPKYRVLV